MPSPLHARTPTQCSSMQEVTKHRYNWDTKTWHSESVLVQIEHQPYAEGQTRVAYRMLDYSLPAGKRACVCKARKRPSRKQCFVDVEMQELCAALAREYNKAKPPKKVKFVDSCVIVCPGTCADGSVSPRAASDTVLMVEAFLKGRYLKYNNNMGYVPPRARSTPQVSSSVPGIQEQ